MSEPVYKFQVGDYIRFLFNGLDVNGLVVDRYPLGGGYGGHEPLYRIHVDEPIPGKYWNNISSIDDAGFALNVHAKFLTLLTPTSEPELISDLASLL